MFAQIIAIVIFLGMFLLIILDKFERHYVTLCSGILVLTIVFGVCMHSFHAVWETLNMTVKSNVLGCEKTAEMLVHYVRNFMEQD